MKRGLLLAALVVQGCVAPGGADGGMSVADGGARTGGAGGGGGGGTTTGGGGGGTVTRDGGVAAVPTWIMADARVAGRTGRDLRIGIKASDRNLDIVSVVARFLDGAGTELSQSALPLESKKWTGETLTAAVWSRGLFASTGPFAAATQVAVTLTDATGLVSDEQILAITEQPVVARGSTCDPLFLENRCEPGLGCRGMPAVCDEGLAPQVTKLGFFRGANGPTILVDGTEPEDDLAAVRFQFQNAQGQPISIDSDGDGTPDLASFEQPANNLAVDGLFLMRLQSGVGLDTQVGKLVATPIDEAGHTGMPKVIAPTTLPVRMLGQTCDPKGFDVCAPTLSCSPGIIGATSNKCASAAPMRTAQCTAAPVLEPTAGGNVVMGTAEGGSLWDAPSGCASADPVGRPEGVVILRLADRADRVRLSTVGSGTSFDTVLYAMPGCPNDTADSLACSDDAPMGAGASELVLENLPAGDYVVVIDSFDPAGGTFELHAILE